MFPSSGAKLLHIRCPEEKEKGICSRRDICIFTHTSDFSQPSISAFPYLSNTYQIPNQQTSLTNTVSYTEDQYDPTNPSTSFNVYTPDPIPTPTSVGITTETLKALSNFLSSHQMNQSINQSNQLPVYQPIQPTLQQSNINNYQPHPEINHINTLSTTPQTNAMDPRLVTQSNQSTSFSSSIPAFQNLTPSQISETLNNLKKLAPPSAKATAAPRAVIQRPVQQTTKKPSVVPPQPSPAQVAEVRKQKSLVERREASSDALMSLGILKPIQKKKPKKVEAPKKPENILDLIPKNEMPIIPYMHSTYAPSIQRRPMLEAFLKLYLQNLKTGETYKDAIKKAVEIENIIYCENVTVPTYKTSCSRKFLEIKKLLETPAAEPVKK